MTKEELVQKLAELEWEDFEVKESKTMIPKDAWETVSSFSNTSGGWIVFGIRQTGKRFEITGLANPEKTEQDFLNTLRGEKFNVLIGTTQQKYIFEGKTVLAFYIPASNKKPVYYNSQTNTFIRRGSSDQRATKEEIDSMFRDQSFGTKTSEIVSGTTISDLDERSLHQYRDYMSRFNPDVSYNRLTEDEFLHKLRIIENGSCTLGGLLFLGKREVIEKHFPDFRIDLLEIPGTSYSDSKTRYTFRLDEHENLWDYYFECFARLKTKVDVSFELTNEGFGQELSTGLNAVRETLVNMLMHADYFSPSHSRIRIFSNRIEFYNPGGLPKPIEELKEKDISLPRNPVIAKLFRMVRLAENAGFGFEKIDFNWRSYNGTEPEYLLSFDSTIVTLPLLTDKKTPVSNTLESADELLAELQKEIDGLPSDVRKNAEYFRGIFGVFSEYFRSIFGVNLEEIRSKSGEKITFTLMLLVVNPEISAQKIAEILGATSRTAENYLAILRKEGIVRREGSDKTGTWKVIDQIAK